MPHNDFELQDNIAHAVHNIEHAVEQLDDDYQPEYDHPPDHLDDIEIPVPKKMMKMPVAFPESKTTAPGQISRSIIYQRAAKIAPSKHISGDDTCVGCHCYRRYHDKKTGKCTRCDGRCNTGFITQDQYNRVFFTEFLRWTRRWLKAGKKRDMKRFSTIWNHTRSVTHLFYCGTCDTPTLTNALHGIVKRQEGLQCSSCRQCSNCCKCVTCDVCKRQKRSVDLCKTCKVCEKCCQCRQCPVCNRDCSYNYCGYAFTDRQKRNNPGCTRCYKCCDCGDYKKVPFGSFKTPIFHVPNRMQHVVNPTSRFISAEIECAGIMGNGRPIYDVVRRWGGGTVGDGSLVDRGFEVNSAPSGGDLYARQINEICAAIKLQNGSIDQKCGLHVHIDARDMNYYDIRRFVRVYAAIEDALFSMVSPERIKGITDADGKLHQYCQPCGKKYVAAIEEGRLPYDKIKSDVITSVYSGPSTKNLRHRKRGEGIPRYNALNLHSWFYRGTIEARMFDGTLDPDLIIKWGIMWAMIGDYVVKSTDEQVAKDMVGKPIACILKIIGDKKILDFVKARVLLFGNDQARRDAIDLL